MHVQYRMLHCYLVYTSPPGNPCISMKAIKIHVYPLQCLKKKIPFFNFMFLLIFFINRFTYINVTRHKFLNKCSGSRRYFTENFKLHSLDSFAVSQILPWWGSKVNLQSVKETLKTRYWPNMDKTLRYPSTCSQQNKSE